MCQGRASFAGRPDGDDCPRVRTPNDSPLLSVQASLEQGFRALEAWSWEEARAIFERIVSEQESPESLEGLAAAAFWLDDGAAAIVARERAYRRYRDRGDAEGAARVAGAVAAVAALAMATSGSGKVTKGAQEIRVLGEITAVHPVDHPPAGPSAGDSNVFTEDLLRGGRRFGRTTGSCLLIAPPASFQCTAIAQLPGGNLTLLANVAEGPATGAITGGTGRFRRARGTFTVHPIAEGRERIIDRVLD